MTREIPPIEWFYRENSKKKVADWRKFEQYQEAILVKFPYLRGRPRVDIWNGFKAGEPSQPKCQAPECDKPVKILAAGWKKYCCNVCSNKGTSEERARKLREKTDEEKNLILTKRKQTNTELFGVEYAAQSKQIREKTIKTNQEKYGVDAPAQSEEIKSRIRSTNHQKYGVEWGLQNSVIREKRRDTMVLKYGTEHALRNKNSKEKRAKTTVERFGVEYASQTPVIQQKTEETTLKKYGSRHIFKSDHFRKKKDAALEKNQIQHLNQIRYSEETKRILFSEQLLREFYDPDSTLTRNADLLSINRSTLTYYLDMYGIDRPEWIPGSQGERDLASFIESMGFVVERNRRDLLKPSKLEIDIFVPELNIGFEYNGLYWHSFNRQPSREEQLYHRKKYELARENNIKLFFITSDLNFEKIKRFVQSKLKNSNRLYARQCSIGSPTVEEYKRFCDEHHIQGYTTASVRLALYHKDKMVGVMGMNRSKTDWILNRMVFGEYSIVGGAKKLLSHFRAEHCGNIISYSSNHYSDGALYDNLGFKLINENKIDLWYVDDEQRLVNRRNLQKSKMAKNFDHYDSNETETTNALRNGYRIYYGPGTKTWVLPDENRNF